MRNLLIYLIPFFVTTSGFCQSVNTPIYRNLKDSFEEYIDGSVEPIYTPMSYKIIWKNEVLNFIEGSKAPAFSWRHSNVTYRLLVGLLFK